MEWGLEPGKLEAYVLQSEDSKTIVVVQREGHRAALSCLYREGNPRTFLSDMRIGLEKVIDRLQWNGVSEVYAFVSVKNPRYYKLMRLYHRLGFGPDMARIGRRI